MKRPDNPQPTDALTHPLPWLAVQPWATQWKHRPLPDDVQRWLKSASDQELMTIIAAATCRLIDPCQLKA